jgi:hypothetical protein
MKINVNSFVLLSSIICLVIIGITVSGAMAHITNCNICNACIDNYMPQKANKNNNEPIKKIISLVNNRNSETAGDLRCLSVTNVIQRVLENTLKENADIAIMAVYAEDGTILAHLKHERIGKNMFDADEELSHCINDMYKAMKSRRIYSGYKYDPLLNEDIRFMLKPLQIGNFDQKLSLLIGVYKPK